MKKINELWDLDTIGGYGMARDGQVVASERNMRKIAEKINEMVGAINELAKEVRVLEEEDDE